MTETKNGHGIQIEAIQITLTTIEVEIEGTSPLMVSRFSEKAKRMIAAKQQGESTTNKKREIRKPVEEFHDARYKIDEQTDGFPAIGLKAAMIDAGYRYMGLTKVDLKGDMHINLELVPIIASEPEMSEDMVRLAGINRPADIRYRPKYDPWSMRIPITYKPDRLSAEQIVTMLAHAGFSGGIGEWRPSRDGIYGTFQPKTVEQVANPEIRVESRTNKHPGQQGTY